MGKGVVVQVEPGGQAEGLGVKEGWRFSRVSGQRYTEARLDEKVQGNKVYEVEFVAVEKLGEKKDDKVEEQDDQGEKTGGDDEDEPDDKGGEGEERG